MLIQERWDSRVREMGDGSCTLGLLESLTSSSLLTGSRSDRYSCHWLSLRLRSSLMSMEALHGEEEEGRQLQPGVSCTVVSLLLVSTDRTSLQESLRSMDG